MKKNKFTDSATESGHEGNIPDANRMNSADPAAGSGYSAEQTMLKAIVSEIVKEEMQTALKELKDEIRKEIVDIIHEESASELRAFIHDTYSSLLTSNNRVSSEKKEIQTLATKLNRAAGTLNDTGTGQAEKDDDLAGETHSVENNEITAAGCEDRKLSQMVKSMKSSATEGSREAGEKIKAAPTGDNGEDTGKKALYVYAITGLQDDVSLGNIGVEESTVYTISTEDPPLTAIVHECPSIPYQSEDQEIVKKWIQEHQNVIETSIEKFGNVLPFGFDTIIQEDDLQNADEVLKKWLTDEYQILREKLDGINGKKEYGIQIFCSPQVILSDYEDNEELKKINNEIQSKGAGAAYLYNKKIEQIKEKARGDKLIALSDKFLKEIEDLSSAIKVDKSKKSEDPGKIMLLNLSCLVENDKYKKLGDLLEDITNRDGFFVRFTGPWPPYSFV